jgi:hypothetical protein
MNQTLEEIKALELKINSVDLQDTETQSEEALEAPKAIPKKKRVPSEKQLEVLRNAREKLAVKQKEKIVKKKLEQEAMEQEVQRRLNEYKEGLEQKIVKKAISIKKKQIKKEAVLDEISDDETPMEAIKQIAKKKKQLIPPVDDKPKYIFV